MERYFQKGIRVLIKVLCLDWLIDCNYSIWQKLPAAVPVPYRTAFKIEDFLFPNYMGNTESYLKIGTIYNQCEPVSRKEFQNMPGPVPQYVLQWE